MKCRRFVLCQTNLYLFLPSDGEANFIGFVESEAQNNQVSVNIFYLSNVGIVSKPLSYVLDAKDLWLATDDEFKIAKNGGFALQSSISNGFWRFFLAESPSSKDTTGTGTELPLAFPENLDSSLERPVGSHQLNTEPPEGNLLNRRISRPQAAESVEFPVVQPTTTCQLGALLDGRKIYWFHSDPEALYVCATGFYNDPQSALSEERQIRAENAYLEDVIADSSPLPRRTAPRHLPCCILGCTERRSDSSITCRFFPSRPLLLAHYHAHHNFGTDQDTSKRFLSGQLDRIEQKEGIQLLMCSIAASACAIDSSLLCLTASVGGDGGPVEASRASPMTPLFCFSSDAATSAKTKELARGGLRSPRASQLLKLGLTVSTLFENDGTSKKTTHGSRDGKPSSPLRTLDGGHSQVVSDACHICNIGSERTVRTDDGSGYKGLGCAAASTVCLGGVLEGEEKRLSNAQKLLLAAARRAPKARENAGATPIPQLSQQLWCDKSLDTWQILVTRSRSLAALVHATAILVSSLDRKMLPEWWIDDCNGWSHVQSVLQIDSIERLYLYLYVLDAALCEYASVAMTSFENVPKAALPPEFKGSTYDEIVGQVFAYMKSHDIPTFQGINGEYCCVCSDGGELLCCELCSNVQHPDCVLPEPLKYTPDRFVCTCCIVDVAVLIRETIS